MLSSMLRLSGIDVSTLGQYVTFCLNWEKKATGQKRNTSWFVCTRSTPEVEKTLSVCPDEIVVHHNG